MKKVFTAVYKQIVINEEALKNVRKLCADRKGPIVFCPTHRSYVDFLLVSSVLYYYNMEVPHICAGEDLMMIKGISHVLRASGAFFMRRTFRGDPLYKAIFTGYVEMLCQDKMIMEFFIEGTRSRTNKMLAPKFGILKIMTDAFFDKKIEEVTFIPVTINYTRTLEGESFPNELTGESKVKESLSRIVKAFSILAMNFGTIHLDFYAPIKLSETVKSFQKIKPELNPFKNRADRLPFNNDLGNKMVFILQNHIRIMPTTLVASILMLYRKGITEDQLVKKVSWLGMALNQRGAVVTTDSGLPNEQTLKIGLYHLKDYITLKRNIYMPKVSEGNYHNYIMLGYYRNPLNFIFYTESIIVCSIMSFGREQAWKKGVSVDELYKRTSYLAELLKREEVMKEYLQNNRPLFDSKLAFMQSQRMLTIKDEQVYLKSSGEALTLMVGSICWPMVDTYYVVLLFALTLIKMKNTLDANLTKDVQWMAETLFIERKTMFYEACNQPAIGNAKAAFLQMKVLAKTGPAHIGLCPEYQKQAGEKKLLELIDFVGQYRMKPTDQSMLDDVSG